MTAARSIIEMDGRKCAGLAALRTTHNTAALTDVTGAPVSGAVYLDEAECIAQRTR